MVGGSLFSVSCSSVCCLVICSVSMLMLRFSVLWSVGRVLFDSVVAMSLRSVAAVRLFAGLFVSL